ncbi:MAG: 1-aminocyclopropane-1-carboxylate deaminase/D-cysteine desulfhydrase [Bacteroidota bacterium]
MRLDELFLKSAVIEPLQWPTFEKAGLDVHVLREDLRHPWAGGNKAWKLRHNLEAYYHSGKEAMLSFGGAYSNHLLALSSVCNWMGIPFHAVIRGEERPVNSRIMKMIEQGTHIHYCSRSDYRKRKDELTLKELLSECCQDIPAADELFVIPEGGDNTFGIKGCTDMAGLIPSDANQVWMACGTGCTLLGMRIGLEPAIRAVGVPVVRNFQELTEKMQREVASTAWQLLDGYQEGGYGKSSPRLEHFINTFSGVTGVPLEPTYTGKLFFALDDQAGKNMIQRGTKIIVLHSGGVFQE